MTTTSFPTIEAALSALGHKVFGAPIVIESQTPSCAPFCDKLIPDAVLAELNRATTKFPVWPTDPIHALAVVQEEVGELAKEVLQLTYESHKSSPEKVREEAVQTAAMALRFLMSLDRYEFRPGMQHSQNGPMKVPCAACDRGDFQLGHADDCLMNFDTLTP